MALADCCRPLFACRMIHRYSPAVVVLERPPPIFLTAVPGVWNAFKARETTLAATLVTVRPSSSFPIILQRVKSSRNNNSSIALCYQLEWFAGCEASRSRNQRDRVVEKTLGFLNGVFALDVESELLVLTALSDTE
ncbi:hypothetical protein TNCV_3807381 [Trichonephila clavipes]|nr:hypothetical protein TNCV_3807381 [Trichonephila clavipes]